MRSIAAVVLAVLCNVPDVAAQHQHQTGATLESSENRWASGTAWQPSSTPMLGHHFAFNRWSLMLHYNAFGGVDAQGTDRGDTELVGIGWIMGMLQGPLLGGQFGTRVMLSPEPIMQGRTGYPLLLQTGESAYGRALTDRQHPHDLFMELALTWRRALGDELAFELYLAPSGEPALGPVAYPHRFSALADPLAPLGHHWQDSTHIAFGVITAGLYSRTVKLEASVFNGLEPDEYRYGIDLRRLDSGSIRLTALPSDRWALSGAFGYLRSPEAREPGHSLVRVTASVMYNEPLGEDANWATTAVLGQNRPEENPATTSLLIESSLWANRNVFFGRAEFVEKTAHDFDFGELPETTLLPVTNVVLGYARQFGPFLGVVPAVGLRGSVGVVGDALASRYGTALPFGGMVYLWIAPGLTAPAADGRSPQQTPPGPPHPALRAPDAG